MSNLIYSTWQLLVQSQQYQLGFLSNNIKLQIYSLLSQNLSATADFTMIQIIKYLMVVWMENHLICKRAFSGLAKWLSICVQTKWLCVWVLLQSVNFQINWQFGGSSSLTFWQLHNVDSLQNPFNKNVLILQNVSIPPQLYTTDAFLKKML